ALERLQVDVEVELLDARVVLRERVRGAAELALERARAGCERELRPAAGAGEGVDEGPGVGLRCSPFPTLPQGGGRNRRHCGMGGGTFAKSGASSATSPAFTHCAMPVVHTRVLRLSVPAAICCCRVFMSKGPARFCPIATWKTAAPGIGGGTCPAAGLPADAPA